MTDGDPVSWLVIERGWDVVGADGERIGSVEEVLGDRDIFSGLAISTGLIGKPRWVAAEQVEEIEDGRVRLAIGSGEADRLGDYEPAEPA